MRVGSDHERSGYHVTALHHDLVPNARTRRVEIYPVLSGKCFDRPVFLLVRLILVLDVVVQRKHQLLRFVDLLRPNALELAHDRRRVVVRHHPMRANGKEVARTQRAGRTLGMWACAIFSVMVWGMDPPGTTNPVGTGALAGPGERSSQGRRTLHP